MALNCLSGGFLLKQLDNQALLELDQCLSYLVKVNQKETIVGVYTNFEVIWFLLMVEELELEDSSHISFTLCQYCHLHCLQRRSSGAATAA